MIREAIQSAISWGSQRLEMIASSPVEKKTLATAMTGAFALRFFSPLKALGITSAVATALFVGPPAYRTIQNALRSFVKPTLPKEPLKPLVNITNGYLIALIGLENDSQLGDAQSALNELIEHCGKGDNKGANIGYMGRTVAILKNRANQNSLRLNNLNDINPVHYVKSNAITEKEKICLCLTWILVTKKNEERDRLVNVLVQKGISSFG